ncbi:MAG: DNA cytosine methyltransferase [Dehalococcoidia bacterium]
MMNLVLSVFPGIGLLDRAFEEQGWSVVRGPDVLWGGDVRCFHPPAGIFGGVIGGPPCQEWSTLANLVRAKGRQPRFPNMIPEFTRCVYEAQPEWFLMENVRGAPIPWLAGYGIREFLVDNAWLGEEQRRLRRVTFGLRARPGVDLREWISYAALQLPAVAGTVYQEWVNNTPEAKGRVTAAPLLASGKPAPGQQVKTTAVLAGSHGRTVPVSIGGSGKVKRTAVLAGHGPLKGNGIQMPPVMTAGQPTVWVDGKVLKGAVTSSDGGDAVRMARYSIEEMCRLQGLPEDFLKDAPFTKEGKRSVIGNGVPLFLGRQLAHAVRCATEVTA